jgi:hypothetical protein
LLRRKRGASEEADVAKRQRGEGGHGHEQGQGQRLQLPVLVEEGSVV